MKKLLIIVISVLISIIFVSTGLAFSKPPPERSTKEQMVPEKTPVPDAAPAAEKVLAPKKRTERAKIAGFVGIVAIVDSNLIQVKSKMEEVTFDASNPELKGYNALSDVMVGDTVTVAYTKDGIMITRLKGAVKTKTSEEKKSERTKKRRSKKDTKKIVPRKQVEKPKISGFVGTVTMIYSNLIDVWSKKGEVVTFDASNPELKGYNALSDVMVGDTVTVAYTKDGIMITRLKGAVKTKTSEEKKSEKESKSSRKTVITRITCTGKGPCAVSVDKPED